MKCRARKPFRYGAKVYLPGQVADIQPHDVVPLQRRCCIGAPVAEPVAELPDKPKVETQQVVPAEKAVRPEPEAKYVGGGWYELDGRKVRAKDLP